RPRLFATDRGGRSGPSSPQRRHTSAVSSPVMVLQLPTSLSPSKVASFKDCGLAFKFAAIDRLPEPPSPWSTKGTLVHRALELLFCEPPEQRSLEVAIAGLARAHDELRDHPDLPALAPQPDGEAAFF